MAVLPIEGSTFYVDEILHHFDCDGSVEDFGPSKKCDFFFNYNEYKLRLINCPTLSLPVHCATPFETPVIFFPAAIRASCNSSKLGRIDMLGIIKVECKRNIGFLVESRVDELDSVCRKIVKIYKKYMPWGAVHL